MIDNIIPILVLDTNLGSNKTSFWFVRHGESEGNALGTQCLVMNNTQLTEQGKKEASACAHYLQQNHVKISRIYSSPLERSLQTAQIIGDVQNIQPIPMDDLRERNWGVLGNLPWDEVSKQLSGMDIEARYSFVPDGGESWKEMEHRLFQSLKTILKETTGDVQILIVTHRGCLRAILPVLANASKDKHEDFSVETGSLTKFSFQEQSFEFIGLNPTKKQG